MVPCDIVITALGFFSDLKSEDLLSMMAHSVLLSVSLALALVIKSSEGSDDFYGSDYHSALSRVTLSVATEIPVPNRKNLYDSNNKHCIKTFTYL